MYLFLAVLGLHCWAWASSSCGEQGLLSCGAWASPCSGFSCRRAKALEYRLSSYGTWALSLDGMWNLPRPGIEPVSHALTDRFLITGPPGKPHYFLRAEAMYCWSLNLYTWPGFWRIRAAQSIFVEWIMNKLDFSNVWIQCGITGLILWRENCSCLLCPGHCWWRKPRLNSCHMLSCAWLNCCFSFQAD